MKNLESERAVLSAIKQKNSIYDEIDLKVSDFQFTKNKVIFGAMQNMIERDIEINDLSLFEILQEQKVKVDVAYIARLDLPAVANVMFYVEQIKDYSLRKHINELKLIIESGLQAKNDTNKILEAIEKKITDFDDNESGNIKKIKEFLHPVLDNIEWHFKNKGEIVGVPTGFRKLDQLTNGWQNGTLNIIAARTSLGKTAFALTMATRIAKKNILVGFFSCEMSGQQIAYRMLAGESRINITNMTSGYMRNTDFNKLTTACGTINELSMLIDDTPNPTLRYIKSKARMMKRKGVKIIFIDYLTLIRYGNAKTPRYERVGEMIKELKQLARELELPIIVLSQLNRDAEGKEPTLAHLRASGEIEEDSDTIIFLHRQRMDDEEDEGKIKLTKLIIAKQRQGATTKFDIVFVPQYVNFESKGIE